METKKYDMIKNKADHPGYPYLLRGNSGAVWRVDGPEAGRDGIAHAVQVMGPHIGDETSVHEASLLRMGRFVAQNKTHDDLLKEANDPFAIEYPNQYKGKENKVA